MIMKNQTKEKGTVFIVPGYGMSNSSAPIVKLHKAVTRAGYQTSGWNIAWNRPLSKQVHEIPQDSIVVGFSLGAILAYLVAKQYGCKKTILASMTPVQKYSKALWIREVYGKDMDKKSAALCARDITNIKINPNKLRCAYAILAGELEDKKKVWKPDILIPETNHELNDSYIKAIIKLLP